MSAARGKPQLKINAFTQGKMIAILLEGAITVRELAEATGLHYITVQKYLRELHRAKAVFISGWESDALGRHSIRVYTLGVGKDVKAPKMTRQETTAAYRARQRMKALLQAVSGVAHT